MPYCLCPLPSRKLRPVTHSNSRLAAALSAVVVVLSASVSGQVQGSPQAPAKPAVGTGLVAGQVLDQDTGRGVAGAQVILSARIGPALQGVVPARPAAVAADSQGRFYFGALPAGGYAVSVQAPGHTLQLQPRIIELAEGAKVTDVKVNLRRLGSLTGRVIDDSGTPVVSVEMLLLTRLVNQGRPPVLLPAMRTRTNDRGEYRFPNVPEGEFLVCACLRGDPIPFDGHLLSTLAARPLDLLGAAGRAVTAGSDAVSLDGTLKTLPITFYPSATLASMAERLRLTAGEDKMGVDLTMTAVRAARVSGRIVGATSSVSASQLRLRVMSDTPEAAGITQIVPMLVQPDGRFDFANVPPGEYVLEVNFRPGARGGGPTGAALVFVGARASALQPLPPQGQSMAGSSDPALAPLWAQAPVSVGDRDVTGLVVPLNRTLTVSGRVTFSGSAPPPNPQMLQRIQATVSSVETGPSQRAYFGPLQPDGSFQMTGLIPGRYLLQLSLGAPPWMTLKSVMTAGDDLTDATIVVDRDVDLNVTLTDAVPSSVSGRVGPAGAPEGDPSWLRVFPVDRRFWPEPYAALRRFRTVIVAPDGRFSIGSLPAGEYFLVPASQSGNEWMDTIALETMARTAERIRVNDGDKLVVEVRR
jgi:hypothetical protein